MTQYFQGPYIKTLFAVNSLFKVDEITGTKINFPN